MLKVNELLLEFDLAPSQYVDPTAVAGVVRLQSRHGCYIILLYTYVV